MKGHGVKATLDRYFHISERGSTIGTELRAGTVSFFAMAYIILLNPLILGTSPDAEGYTLGVPQVAAATALVAGVMSIAFGAIAKYPFAMAAGLGMNTFVAVSMVATSGLTWQEAMGLVVIEGLIIVLLAVSGFRTAVFDAIPQPMKAAMGVGIGMFIAMIGFVDGGFVTRVPDAAQTTVPVGLEAPAKGAEISVIACSRCSLSGHAGETKPFFSFDIALLFQTSGKNVTQSGAKIVIYHDSVLPPPAFSHLA